MNAYDGATAAVIGGSIGGLTTALLLRDLGFSVDVFERTPNALDGRGSGIVLQPDTLRWFTERSEQHPEDLSTSTDWVQYLDTDNSVVHRERTRWSYTSWGTFYRALLGDFGTDHYHLGEFACGFDQDERRVTVRFVSGREVSADLVVFADGITSVGRERLDPAAALRYSGYIGWRGTVPERELSEDTRELLRNSISYTVVPHSHITLYPIPGDGGTGPQDRLMNYVWYRNVPEGPDLSELRIDKRGIPGTVSVHPDQVQDRYVDEMRQAARRMLSPAAAEVVTSTATPYVQVVTDVRASRMAEGRVALLGDAACAARPHAAAGTAKAAADAWALSAALEKAAGDIGAALRAWEPAQLELSARLLDRVVAMGNRSQFANTWTPGDPSLRFGLYGPGL
ncbi:FAD-dependent monooxygenase [Streptomyces sp. NPDC005970]|uniref:FAD binding domain-containing protein n=1 Tax=Streptomyces sp. NPDC005970 TaxID=3156723 RepID=UPI0033CE9501